MYRNKKGKLNYDLVLKVFREMLPIIKESANKEAPVITFKTSEGKDVCAPIINSTEVFIEEFYKEQIRDIANDFIKSEQIIDTVSEEFVYKNILRILCSRELYDLETINSSNALWVFEKLKDAINREVESTKVIIIPIVGAFLNRGETCVVGSIEFINSQDFIDKYSFFLDSGEGNEIHANLFEKLRKFSDNCSLIAQVKIPNRGNDIAEIIANEIIKRVCALVRAVLPICGKNHAYFGFLGEEFLENRIYLIVDEDLDNESNTNPFTRMKITRNQPFHKDLNLLQALLPYQQSDGFFSRCESIISKVIKHEKLTDFEQRIWTALYWFGESLSERELNPLIIKYATCLEALFNSREGGISEQISEFAAHVIGTSTEDRMEVYQKVKELYSLRSSSVHGGSTEKKVDEDFLFFIRDICRSALLRMAYLAGEEYYKDAKGYTKFVKYILREHRFFGM
jgi:hypothetical protein